MKWSTVEFVAYAIKKKPNHNHNIKLYPLKSYLKVDMIKVFFS